MPLSVVAVEVLAQQARTELTEALLRACSRSVEGAECVAADDVVDESRTVAVAIVSWATPSTVRVEVGLRQSGRWLNRELRFSPEDAPLEVNTAVGFALGTLAGRVRSGEGRPRDADAPSTHPKEKPSSVPTGPLPAPESRSIVVPPDVGPEPLTDRQSSTAWWPGGLASRPLQGGLEVQVGSAVVRTWSSGSPSFGGILRGTWIHPCGWWFVGISGRATLRPSGTSGVVTRESDGGINSGVQWTLSPQFKAAWAAEFLVQQVYASVSASRRHPGERGDLDGGTLGPALRSWWGFSYLFTPGFGGFVAPEVTFPLRLTDVAIRNQLLYRAQPAVFGVTAGLLLSTW